MDLASHGIKLPPWDWEFDSRVFEGVDWSPNQQPSEVDFPTFLNSTIQTASDKAHAYYTTLNCTYTPQPHCVPHLTSTEPIIRLKSELQPGSRWESTFNGGCPYIIYDDHTASTFLDFIQASKQNATLSCVAYRDDARSVTKKGAVCRTDAEEWHKPRHVQAANTCWNNWVGQLNPSQDVMDANWYFWWKQSEARKVDTKNVGQEAEWRPSIDKGHKQAGDTNVISVMTMHEFENVPLHPRRSFGYHIEWKTNIDTEGMRKEALEWYKEFHAKGRTDEDEVTQSHEKFLSDQDSKLAIEKDHGDDSCKPSSNLVDEHKDCDSKAWQQDYTREYMSKTDAENWYQAILHNSIKRQMQSWKLKYAIEEISETDAKKWFNAMLNKDYQHILGKQVEKAEEKSEVVASQDTSSVEERKDEKRKPPIEAMMSKCMMSIDSQPPVKCDPNHWFDRRVGQQESQDKKDEFLTRKVKSHSYNQKIRNAVPASIGNHDAERDEFMVALGLGPHKGKHGKFPALSICDDDLSTNTITPANEEEKQEEETENSTLGSKASTTEHDADDSAHSAASMNALRQRIQGVFKTYETGQSEGLEKQDEQHETFTEKDMLHDFAQPEPHIPKHRSRSPSEWLDQYMSYSESIESVKGDHNEKVQKVSSGGFTEIGNSVLDAASPPTNEIARACTSEKVDTEESVQKTREEWNSFTKKWAESQPPIQSFSEECHISLLMKHHENKAQEEFWRICQEGTGKPTSGTPSSINKEVTPECASNIKEDVGMTQEEAESYFKNWAESQSLIRSFSKDYQIKQPLSDHKNKAQDEFWKICEESTGKLTMDTTSPANNEVTLEFTSERSTTEDSVQTTLDEWYSCFKAWAKSLPPVQSYMPGVGIRHPIVAYHEDKPQHISWEEYLETNCKLTSNLPPADVNDIAYQAAFRWKANTGADPLQNLDGRFMHEDMKGYEALPPNEHLIYKDVLVRDSNMHRGDRWTETHASQDQKMGAKAPTAGSPSLATKDEKQHQEDEPFVAYSKANIAENTPDPLGEIMQQLYKHYKRSTPRIQRLDEFDATLFVAPIPRNDHKRKWGWGDLNLFKKDRQEPRKRLTKPTPWSPDESSKLLRELAYEMLSGKSTYRMKYTTYKSRSEPTDIQDEAEKKWFDVCMERHTLRWGSFDPLLRDPPRPTKLENYESRCRNSLEYHNRILDYRKSALGTFLGTFLAKVSFMQEFREDERRSHKHAQNSSISKPPPSRAIPRFLELTETEVRIAIAFAGFAEQLAINLLTSLLTERLFKNMAVVFFFIAYVLAVFLLLGYLEEKGQKKYPQGGTEQTIHQTRFERVTDRFARLVLKEFRASTANTRDNFAAIKAIVDDECQRLYTFFARTRVGEFVITILTIIHKGVTRFGRAFIDKLETTLHRRRMNRSDVPDQKCCTICPPPPPDTSFISATKAKLDELSQQKDAWRSIYYAALDEFHSAIDKLREIKDKYRENYVKVAHEFGKLKMYAYAKTKTEVVVPAGAVDVSKIDDPATRTIVQFAARMQAMRKVLRDGTLVKGVSKEMQGKAVVSKEDMEKTSEALNVLHGKRIVKSKERTALKNSAKRIERSSQTSEAGLPTAPGLRIIINYDDRPTTNQSDIPISKQITPPVDILHAIKHAIPRINPAARIYPSGHSTTWTPTPTPTTSPSSFQSDSLPTYEESRMDDMNNGDNSENGIEDAVSEPSSTVQSPTTPRSPSPFLSQPLTQTEPIAFRQEVQVDTPISDLFHNQGTPRSAWQEETAVRPTRKQPILSDGCTFEHVEFRDQVEEGEERGDWDIVESEISKGEEL